MNKKQNEIIWLAVVLGFISLAFVHAPDRMREFIKTNYFELPRNYYPTLQRQLRSNNLETLSSRGVEVLGDYLSEKLLGNPMFMGTDIRGNYFWNIYNALPSFVNARERHTGYNQGARDYSISEQLMAYAIYRIDRSPENLNTIFEFAKPRLRQIVSTSAYKDMGIQSYVEEAIHSYQQLSQIPNHRMLLQRAYNQADTTTGAMVWEGDQQYFRKFENSAYGFSMWDLNQIIAGHLNLDRHTDLPYSPWLSFWMRRNHEGNMQAVYTILTEIQKIYSGSSSGSYGDEVSHLPHDGKIVYFEKWNDRNGENVLILSEEREEIASWGPPTTNVKLFAYHYAVSGNRSRLLAKHTDSQMDCGFENRARFMEEAVVVADADNNGFSEVTFTYRLGCTSELSPDGLVLVTMENGRTYTIEGSTRVELDRNTPSMGGETRIGNEFRRANPELLGNAQKLWDKQQRNHHGANSPRIYQLSDMERFHNLILIGVEPFWSVRLHSNRLVFRDLSDKEVWYNYTEIIEIDGGYNIIAENSNSNDIISVSFYKGTCFDGMSDNTYPFQSTISKKGYVYEGCARWYN